MPHPGQQQYCFQPGGVDTQGLSCNHFLSELDGEMALLGAPRGHGATCTELGSCVRGLDRESERLPATQKKKNKPSLPEPPVGMAELQPSLRLDSLCVETTARARNEVDSSRGYMKVKVLVTQSVRLLATPHT